jgi:hypothetical protein
LLYLSVVKRELYDIYNWSANGALSAPLKAGVPFLSFQLGGSYKNTVRSVPGVGATRINDAARRTRPVTASRASMSFAKNTAAAFIASRSRAITIVSKIATANGFAEAAATSRRK